MPDLLLELFSEEIPARLQERAAGDLHRLMGDALKAAGFEPEAAKAFATPRRLTLLVTGLPPKQADQREERKGPRVGAPEKAIEGFLRGAGLQSIDEARIESDKKGEYYVATVETKGRPTPDVIAEIIPALVKDFPWPKSMRWGDGELRWVRPLHRILCTFDGEVVPFSVAGIESGDLTEGHRFIAPGEIQVRSFEPYREALARAKVILDPEERREKILGEAKALASAQGLTLVDDEGLLREVAGLAEWPVARIGSFDEKFLTVPAEALIASMRGHQKYFSVRNPETGALAPRFICVANVEPEDGGAAMMRGYERVLEARLSDAWFLYHQDLKTPLAVHADRLADITYFEGLGTVAEKAGRIRKLAGCIATALKADVEKTLRAADLAKADLVTEMVGEFPELQGIMGQYYARAAGEDEEVAQAIAEHYKPAGQDDAVPTAPVSVAVALADKLTTLTDFWSIGEKPTGSKDPFALRRMALGVIQILFDGSHRLSLRDYYDGLPKETAEDLLDFFHDRLEVFLRGSGHAHDRVRAALALRDDDLVLAVRRLNAVEQILEADEGERLLAAYKRARNILRAEEKKDGAAVNQTVDPALLEMDEERELAEKLAKVQETAEPAIKLEAFGMAMSSIASLQSPLDAFFEAVTVNAEDAALRRNRLALLKNIVATCDRVADFSHLEG